MTDRIANLISIGRLAQEHAGDDEVEYGWQGVPTQTKSTVYSRCYNRSSSTRRATFGSSDLP